MSDRVGSARPAGAHPAAGSRDPEPSWANWANALTLLRVALVPGIGVLVVNGGRGPRWWAFGLFVFAALTDTFDGWVARRALGVTRWGQLADPVADKLLVVGVMAVLAFRDALPAVAVVVVVVREVAVTVQRNVLRRRGVVMPASRFGKAKTASQLLAVSLYLLPVAPGGVAPAALVVALVLTVASGLEYAARGRRLLRAR